MTTIDPGTGSDAFDAYHHFHMDWDEAQGKEARYVSDTTDFLRFPNDIRLTNNGNNNGQSGQVARIRGKRFLFVEGQSGSYIAFYRFDESSGNDIAIPCGGIDYGNGIDWVNQPVTGQEFIWRDVDNDGTLKANELLQPANATHVDGQQWWVDTDGNIWQVAYYSSKERSIHVRRYLFQGFDGNGAPIYDYDHVNYFNVPPNLTDIQSVVFEPKRSSGGTLYLAGDQDTTAYAGTFTKLARYDRWDEGNRTATWTIDVPWTPDPSNTYAPNQFRVAGDFVFVDYQVPHIIEVFRVKDGTLVGQITPGTNIGGENNVGNTDEPLSIGAYQRADGQYVITQEDDYQAKTVMYRWNAEHLKTPALPAAPTGLIGTGEDETANLSWAAVPGALHYQLKRGSVQGGPYTVVADGIFTTTASDPGLTNGQTYYYVVTVQTVTGTSANSNEVAITAVAEGTTYEAEFSHLANGGAVVACPKCSGGARMGNVIPATTLTFSNVLAPSAGTYSLRVYYGNGDSTLSDYSTLGVTPNGGATVAAGPFRFTGDSGIPTYTAVMCN